MAIHRISHLEAVQRHLSDFPVVAIIGPRQVGKTTLAQQVMRAWQHSPTVIFDLESPADLARLDEPLRALQELRGLVVLDEVQRLPKIFRVLRVLADRPRRPARFLVLGSASPELLRQSSESLAGRVANHELDGFRLSEVGPENLSRLWLRGGFPRSYLAASNARSSIWREEFIRSFLERDLPTYTFVTRLLKPFHANIKKRQEKSPKVYVADTGLLHTLLGLQNHRDLEGHPKVGASWEGFLSEQVCGLLGVPQEQAHFWSTHTGAELDLAVARDRKLHGFEFKRTVSPRVPVAMHTAIDELGFDSLTIVHAGRESFNLRRGIRAVAAARIVNDLRKL